MKPTQEISGALAPGKHWIAGEWRLDVGMPTFDLRQRVAPHEPIGSWPRGDGGLLRSALDGAGAGLAAWRAGAQAERTVVLARALELVRADELWGRHLERYLGLAPNELAGEHAGLEALHEELSLAPASELAAEGVTFLFTAWHELVAGTARRLVASLASGRAAVLVADERWPLGADVLARALEAAGLPAGLVSVLHGSEEACQTAVTDPEDVHGRALGAAALAWSVDVPRVDPEARSYVVEESADLERAAADVVQRAFGRANTLSGQRPGRVGRVVCHRAVFSAFTDRLLAAVASDPSVNDPLPLIDGRGLAALRSAWDLGLDEGATLIFGGEAFARGAGGVARTERRVWPTIFTNVEPSMAIGRPPAVGPLLGLMRSRTDAHAQELARKLG